MFRRTFTLFSPRIAVAMSGGIDSAVTAMILKEQGYSCVGVFMRNWDNADEDGESRCSISKDFEDMKLVCKHLDIEAVEVEFIKEYWTNVFEPFLDAYRAGATPNPDVMCNKYIKFHYFKEFVKQKLDIEHMATGHYANVSYIPTAVGSYIPAAVSSSPSIPILMRGRDRSKDQSYFLALTERDALRNVLFPLGGLQKAQVKSIARAHPVLSRCVEVLAKKESMGLCFVGKRREPFSHFLSKYINITPGRFVDAVSGKVLGSHSGAEALTLGQKANIHSQRNKFYVVSKEALPPHSLAPGDVLVGEGREHPLLFKDRVRVDLTGFHWGMGGERPLPAYLLEPVVALLDSTAGPREVRGPMPLLLPYHGQPVQPGDVQLLDPAALLAKYLPAGTSTTDGDPAPPAGPGPGPGTPLSFSISLSAPPGAEEVNSHRTADIVVHGLRCMHRYRGELAVCSVHFSLSKTSNDSDSDRDWKLVSERELDIRFESSQRAITSGQILAFYDGDYLVGGGTIIK